MLQWLHPPQMEKAKHSDYKQLVRTLHQFYNFDNFNTSMPNGVKMTLLDSLLVHIFSLACFQRKSSRDFSSFVGPYTVLEWREFLSALKTIF